MTYKIYNTSNWTNDRLRKYGPDILQAIQKLAQKYKDEISLDILSHEIIHGNRQLWIILKEEKFSAFVTTNFEITQNGKKRLTLLELSGKGGVVLAKMIEPIEQYARDNQADEICAIARMGWTKIMRNLGYQPEFVKFKKKVNDGTFNKRTTNNS